MKKIKLDADKLQLNKEKIVQLTDAEAKILMGGMDVPGAPMTSAVVQCASNFCNPTPRTPYSQDGGFCAVTSLIIAGGGQCV